MKKSYRKRSLPGEVFEYAIGSLPRVISREKDRDVLPWWPRHTKEIHSDVGSLLKIAARVKIQINSAVNS